MIIVALEIVKFASKQGCTSQLGHFTVEAKKTTTD
jgi:hypothetical protein